MIVDFVGRKYEIPEKDERIRFLSSNIQVQCSMNILQFHFFKLNSLVLEFTLSKIFTFSGPTLAQFYHTIDHRRIEEEGSFPTYPLEFDRINLIVFHIQRADK